ncbi:lipase 3-like [Euwallacea fornicatus]|uniref:lipase 3-like n=1 Tax=Euwallacea fornicatus TaxID=995702 RepID=UPI003390380B
MRVVLVFFTCALAGALGAAIQPNSDDVMLEILREIEKLGEEGNYTVENLIASNGYPVETHKVTTSDGYILTLHRIPSGTTGASLGKVAYLQHGILASSADWCIMGAGKSLAFILADEGYDVWMGNVRGNSWSREHVSLTTDTDAYWKFSFHEIGTIDLPAIIDYILDQTGVSSIYYAGHSQGTTIYYVMTSTFPEYNEKVKVSINLAPISFMNHMTSPLLKIMSFWTGTLEALTSLIGINEFFPNSDFIKYVIGDALCAEDSVTQFLCTNTLFALCGFSRAQMNTTLLPKITKYTPAGASTKQLLHYGQEIKSGYFREYDYGIISNMKVYGSVTPPRYDLTQITTPTYLFYSKNDWLSAETDVIKLCKSMGDACAGKILMSDFSFNHLDYTFGIDAPSLVYNKIIGIFARY